MSRLYRDDSPDSQGRHAPLAIAPGRSTLTAHLPVRRKAAPAPAAAEAGAATAGQARDDNGVRADAGASVDARGTGGGQGLPPELRGSFEESLGVELGGVRVHTGESSAVAAESLGARAFTKGDDIHFGAGQYQPGDPFGQHLLAHEVAHTVQQHGSPASAPQAKLEVGTTDDPLEAEADRYADAFVQRRASEPAQQSRDAPPDAPGGGQERGGSAGAGPAPGPASAGVKDEDTDVGVGPATTTVASTKSNAAPRVNIVSPTAKKASYSDFVDINVEVFGTPDSTMVLYLTIYRNSAVYGDFQPSVTLDSKGKGLVYRKMMLTNAGASYALHARASSEPGVFSPLRVAEFFEPIDTYGGGV